MFLMGLLCLGRGSFEGCIRPEGGRVKGCGGLVARDRVGRGLGPVRDAKETVEEVAEDQGEKDGFSWCWPQWRWAREEYEKAP